MSSNLVDFVRDRIQTEMTLIRKLAMPLADMLDAPVPEILPEAARLRPGNDLQPGRGLEMVLRHGWATPEEWGVWSSGSKAALRVAFDPAITFPIKLELDLQAFVRPGLIQSVAISVNGRDLETLEFAPSCGERVHVIEIDAGDVSPDFLTGIAFDIANPTAPADIEPSSDRRKLGVAIRRLRIS